MGSPSQSSFQDLILCLGLPGTPLRSVPGLLRAVPSARSRADNAQPEIGLETGFDCDPEGYACLVVHVFAKAGAEAEEYLDTYWILAISWVEGGGFVVEG